VSGGLRSHACHPRTSRHPADDRVVILARLYSTAPTAVRSRNVPPVPARWPNDSVQVGNPACGLRVKPTGRRPIA
jgi:hypothetical protein